MLTDEELDQINIAWWESSTDRHPAELRRLVAKAAWEGGRREALGEAAKALCGDCDEGLGTIVKDENTGEHIHWYGEDEAYDCRAHEIHTLIDAGKQGEKKT